MRYDDSVAISGKREANPAIGDLGTGAQRVEEELPRLYDFDVPAEHCTIALVLGKSSGASGAAMSWRVRACRLLDH